MFTDSIFTKSFSEDEEFCRIKGLPEDRFSRLHKRLLKLKKRPPSSGCVGFFTGHRNLGICANVDMWSFLTDEEILDMWSKWEHWSGDIDWPIRYTGIGEQGKWEGKTKQSIQRYGLLDHCISYLEQLTLKEQQNEE